MNENTFIVKNKIDMLTNEIIELEDQNLNLGKEKSDYLKNQEKIVNEIEFDFEKNLGRIHTIKKLMINDKSSFDNQIIQKQKEKLNLVSKINEFNNEIYQLGKQKQENNNLNQQIDIAFELKLDSEKRKKKNEKNIFKIQNFETELEINRKRINGLNEGLLMLKEEKSNSKDLLYDLLSQKETVDELIKSFSLKSDIGNTTFKSLEISNDEFRLFAFEIKCLDFELMVNYFHQYFTKKELLIDKSVLRNIVTHSFSLLKNIEEFNCDDFFLILSKKIKDVFDKNKSSILEFEKISWILKLLLRDLYVYQTIEKINHFVNSEYKTLKNHIVNDTKELEARNKSLKNEINSLKQKLTDVDVNRLDLEEWDKRKSHFEESNLLIDSQIKNLEEKIQNLKIENDEKELEIESLRIKSLQQMTNYENQIYEIERLNIEIQEQSKVKNNEIYNDEIDQLIKKNNEKILDKKSHIKELLSKISNENNQKSSLINSYFDKINETLSKTKTNETNQNMFGLTNSLRNSMSKLVESYNKDFFHKSQKTKNEKDISFEMNMNDLNNETNHIQNPKSKTVNDKLLTKSTSMINLNNNAKTTNLVKNNAIITKPIKYSTGKSVVRACCQSKIMKNEKIYQTSNFQFKKNKIQFRYEACQPEDLELLEKLRPLLEGIYVFVKIPQDRNRKELDVLNLNESKITALNFIEGILILDKNLKKVSIVNRKNVKFIEIPISNIENIEISKSMSQIVSIHKLFKKFRKQKIDSQQFFQSYRSSSENNFIFSDDYRNRCLETSFFALSLITSDKILLDLIFNSFQEYECFTKTILKVLKLIKNLSKIQSLIK